MIPASLAHYRLLRPLGAGGMGEVYLAEDTKLGRQVALKVLAEPVAADPERRQRFEREARAIAALNHPNIVTIHSVEEDQGLLFLTMELVEGKTLDAFITPGGMALDQLLAIAIPLADAVGAAHQRAITHRDLKPANVMLSQDGRVKVLDFGLAKLRDDVAASSETDTTRALTGEGKIVGTVAYMSPEQAEGKAVDVRSDVFSLGIVLYEMACGQRPFAGDTNVSVMSAILKDTPKPLTELRADLPRELAKIVKRCLQKDPEQRYQTAKDLRNDLQSLKEELVSGELSAARTSVDPGVLALNKRRAAWVLVGASAIVVGAIAGIGWGVSRARPASDASSTPPFSAIRLTKLTTHGAVTRAAISSDGRLVAYARREDGGRRSVWVRQVASSNDVQILPAADRTFDALVFSPDGEYLYFTRRPAAQSVSALYRIPSLGGPERRLLDDVRGSVAVAPDGRRLSIVRADVVTGELSLLIVGTDGPGERTLMTRRRPEAFSSGPAWSPDGNRIAVATVATGRGGAIVYQLVVCDIATREERVLAELPMMVSVAWLSDGTRLLVTGNENLGPLRQVWTVAYPGGQRRRLTSGFSDYVQLSAARTVPTFASVAVETRSNLWVLGAGAREARQITSGSGMDGRFRIDWLPDGRILYASESGEDAVLALVSANDPGLRQVITEPGQLAHSPVASNDGRLIAFQSDRSGALEVWVMEADGNNVRQVTRTGHAVGPHFTADGQSIVFSGRSRGVWKVPVAGGDPTRVFASELPPTAAALALSPDGRLLVFSYQDEQDRGASGSRFGVVSMDGSQAWRKLPGVPATAGLLDLTADGQAITHVVTTNDVSNVWQVPIDGTTPTQLTHFTSGRIFGLGWSRDGKYLALSRGTTTSDVILISDDTPPSARP